MYQVIEYFTQNAHSTAADAISYFGKEFEITQQIQYIKEENDRVVDLRRTMRPLYAQKRDLEEKLKYIIIDVDSDVAIKYPPRNGTDTERKKYQKELLDAHRGYQMLNEQFKEVAEQIWELEQELDAVERNAKNGRRLSELYDTYVKCILIFKAQGAK